MTPAERLRKHQRALEKTQRELDRERVKLENQEKKLVADIKKSAKEWPDRCLQDPGQRPCPDEAVYPEVLPDEDTIAGYQSENTGAYHGHLVCDMARR